MITMIKPDRLIKSIKACVCLMRNSQNKKFLKFYNQMNGQPLSITFIMSVNPTHGAIVNSDA
jgi:hypothetical protein